VLAVVVVTAAVQATVAHGTVVVMTDTVLATMARLAGVVTATVAGENGCYTDCCGSCKITSGSDCSL
jgi:hypothetical protein